ncbi:hypothetical protein Tco_0745295 [Tanacetum coccineum]
MYNLGVINRLKGIRMKYLPQTIWRQSDRDKAGAMIQAIDKQLKTRRIMQSLEKFFDESNANVLERFYTLAGKHVKEILLKLNLPDHRSILMDSKMEVKVYNFALGIEEKSTPAILGYLQQRAKPLQIKGPPTESAARPPITLTIVYYV